MLIILSVSGFHLMNVCIFIASHFYYLVASEAVTKYESYAVYELNVPFVICRLQISICNVINVWSSIFIKWFTVQIIIDIVGIEFTGEAAAAGVYSF